MRHGVSRRWAILLRAHSSCRSLAKHCALLIGVGQSQCLRRAAPINTLTELRTERVKP